MMGFCSLQQKINQCRILCIVVLIVFLITPKFTYSVVCWLDQQQHNLGAVMGGGYYSFLDSAILKEISSFLVFFIYLYGF